MACSRSSPDLALYISPQLGYLLPPQESYPLRLVLLRGPGLMLVSLGEVGQDVQAIAPILL